jgi:hypothetical protein
MDCWSRRYWPVSAWRADRPQEVYAKSAGSEKPQVVQAAACGNLVCHAEVLGQNGVIPPGLQRPPVCPEDLHQFNTPAKGLKEDSHGEPLLPSLLALLAMWRNGWPEASRQR